MSNAAVEVPKDDCSLWPINQNQPVVMGLDLAFHSDRSVLAQCQVFRTMGRDVVGFFSIHRFDKGELPDAVADFTVRQMQRYSHPFCIFDVTSDPTFASVLASRFASKPANYLMAASITQAAECDAFPHPMMCSARGRPVALPKVSLAKSAIITGIATEMRGLTVAFTETGDGPQLREELKNYQRNVRASGSVQYTAPPGQTDDTVMAVAMALHAARTYAQPRRNVTRQRRPTPGVQAWT